MSDRLRAGRLAERGRSGEIASAELLGQRSGSQPQHVRHERDPAGHEPASFGDLGVAGPRQTLARVDAQYDDGQRRHRIVSGADPATFLAVFEGCSQGAPKLALG